MREHVLLAQPFPMELLYRRRLPHWRNDEVIYLVTWRLAKGQPELDSAERNLVAQALKHFDGQRYRLAAYVVMNDHVHALVMPLGTHRLKGILHSWKSFTAHQMRRDPRRAGHVWQDEYFDRIIRDDKEFLQKLRYIVNNPSKRWPDLEAYPWVWPTEE
jgi:REP-associated tyrosine transposase